MTNEPPEIQAERLPENKIVVSKNLNSPHQLIQGARKNLVGQKPYRGMVHTFRGDIDIRVAPASVSRALRIMDALIKALEFRGMKIVIATNENKVPTYVEIFNQRIRISIYEVSKMVKRENVQFGDNSYDYIPTGRLVIKISRGYDEQPQCGDRKNKRLEDDLNNVVITLYKYAFEERAAEIKRQQEHLKWREQELQSEELAKQREIEQQKILAFETAAMNWKKSKLLRAYLEELKKAQKGSLVAGSEFDQWLGWAGQYVDGLSPLKHV